MALTFRQKESYAMTRLATTDSFNDGYSSEEEDDDEDDSEIINFRYNESHNLITQLKAVSRN